MRLPGGIRPHLSESGALGLRRKKRSCQAEGQCLRRQWLWGAEEMTAF